jgi:hypothetical protein
MHILQWVQRDCLPHYSFTSTTGVSWTLSTCQLPTQPRIGGFKAASAAKGAGTWVATANQQAFLVPKEPGDNSWLVLNLRLLAGIQDAGLLEEAAG